MDDEIKLEHNADGRGEISFAKALKKVLAADQDRAPGTTVHRKEIGSDPAFTGESDEARGITA